MDGDIPTKQETKAQEEAIKDEQNRAQVAAQAELAAKALAIAAPGIGGKVGGALLRNEKVQGALATVNKYKKTVTIIWTLWPLWLFIIIFLSTAALIQSITGLDDASSSVLTVLTECSDGVDFDCVKETVADEVENRMNNQNNDTSI
jgi:hypothetical protein